STLFPYTTLFRSLVVHHRVDAVVVGQREIEQLELDRKTTHPAASNDLDRAAIDAGRTIASRVNLDPDRLVLVRPDLDRESSPIGPHMFRHELYGLPAGGVARGRRRAGRIDPVGVRRHR